MNRREWLRAWPDHCTTCEGHTDSANPCQDCLGDFLTCPRCGRIDTLHPEDATVPCTACGWVQGAGMGCPPSRAMLRDRKRYDAEQLERERRAEIRRLETRLAELKR